MTRIAVFPGQGSQAVGMGLQLATEFASARDTFAAVDEALGESLSTIIFEGPEKALTATANAQPALLAVSVAALRALEARTGARFADLFDYAAGHSLGEYSALVATGALPLAEAVRLVRLRGQAMQAAVAPGEGAMAAVLGMDPAVVERLAKDAASVDGVCELANDNGLGQAVLSGRRATVERAVELAKKLGASRAIMLQVSAPFHCSLMRPAAELMRRKLRETGFAPVTRPVIANVTATPVTDPAAWPALLTEQVTARVRWRETMMVIAELGATQVVELGPGRVLSGLVKRALPAVKVHNVQSAQDVELAAAALER